MRPAFQREQNKRKPNSRESRITDNTRRGDKHLLDVIRGERRVVFISCHNRGRRGSRAMEEEHARPGGRQASPCWAAPVLCTTR
eukprot:3455801-Pyramimonas_sp.AAC.1